MSYLGHATAQPQGQVVDYSQGVARAFLPIRPNHRFDLVFNPARWFWAGPDYGFLPELGRLFYRPGADGVSKNGIGHAINNHAVRGNIVLRIASLPGPLQSCVTAWDAAHMGEVGKYYAYSWASLKRIGNKVRATVDEQARNDFLRGLIDHHVIDPISDEARDLYIAEMEYRLEKYRNRAESPGRQNSRRCRQEIEMMERTLREIEKHYSSPDPAPKPRRKGTKSTNTADQGDS